MHDFIQDRHDPTTYNESSEKSRSRVYRDFQLQRNTGSLFFLFEYFLLEGGRVREKWKPKRKPKALER